MKTFKQLLEQLPANPMSKPKKPKKKQERDPGYTYNANDPGIGLSRRDTRNTRQGGHSYSANDL